MTIGVCIVLGLIAVGVVLMYAGAIAIERRWQMFHPPDDWDGMREDNHEQDSGE